MRLRKSDKLWENYCRVIKAMNDLPAGTDQWCELNAFAWKILEKYLEALQKEFLQ